MKVSRPWLAAVFVLFFLPLFVGLGRRDITGDEAAHTFSVERILEIGDWLAPRNSPSEDDVFLEKPPLKFWIVAAPIKLGLLPRDEFGFRFWDAMFGGIAFLYVFAIGSRLINPIAGAVAVLILFVERPLLFEHGLRGNNMEAALLLCYCGGIYHYMRAMAAGERGGRARHTAAVGLYFVLGFMVKDVAALFMPATLFLTSLVFAEWRAKLLRDWRAWAASAALAVALIAPWFLYVWHRFGGGVWSIMFGTHVYTRLTSYLDPAHLHPWHFYFSSFYKDLGETESFPLVVAGLAVLLVQAIRRRWAEGGAVVLWFVFPLVTISIGTSKLYHYAYPFLPGAALGGGYLVALVCALAPAPLERVADVAERALARFVPRLESACMRPPARTILLALAILAGGVAIGSLAFGTLKIAIGSTVLFKSSRVFRPTLLLVTAGLLAGATRRASRVALFLIVASLLPLPYYRQTLRNLDTGTHPIRDARDCMLRVAATPEVKALGPPRGLWTDGLLAGHEYYLYFRKIRPWTTITRPASDQVARYLYDRAEQRPGVLLDATYQSFLHGPAAPLQSGSALPPMVNFGEVVLLLPGPYAVCSSEVRRAD